MLDLPWQIWDWGPDWTWDDELKRHLGNRDEEGVMPDYMLLLYAPEVDGTDRRQEDRWAEMPIWLELTESLRRAGLLVGNGPLHSTASATTVRVRDGGTELTDGPFAMTKEILVGYYVLRCTDLDEALHHAARMPTARYGSVEVRPILDLSEVPAPGRGEPRRGEQVTGLGDA
jgi:hypothetical protein